MTFYSPADAIHGTYLFNFRLVGRDWGHFFHDCSFVFLFVSLSMQKNYSKIIDSPSKTASIRLTYVRRMAQRITKFFILTKGTGINLFYFYLCLSFSLIHKKYFREKEKSQSNFIKNKNK